MKDLRFIALVDLDAFFCSVELVEDPSLRGKPVVVGGAPDARGVVASASYEARRYGVHSAMPMARAVRLCPQAVVLPVRHALYERHSQRVMELLAQVTPLLEQVSIDEAYLDLTAVVNSVTYGAELMKEAQRRIREELSLPSSVGLGTSKLVAKIACQQGKPRGFVVVTPGREALFLAPLSIEEMPGIGPSTAKKLRALGINTIGQLGQTPSNHLAAVLGSYGPLLHRLAKGEDPTPVRTERQVKSVSEEETFPRDITRLSALMERLGLMCRHLAENLAREGLAARTVTLKLRYADFTTITRSLTRQTATASAEVLEKTAGALLERNWDGATPVRLIGVGVSNFMARPQEQQSLWSESEVSAADP